MRTIYIDDSGSLHPKSKDKYFVLGAISVAEKDIKSVRKRVKSILKLIKKPELKANELTKQKKITLFKSLNNYDVEYLANYLDIKKLKNKFPDKFKKFRQEFDNLLRAIGISLISEYFVNKYTVITDVIFDKVFTKNVSDNILKIVKTIHIYKRSYIRYIWIDSAEDKCIQVADIIANSYFRHLEIKGGLFEELKSKLISEGIITELSQKWYSKVNRMITKRQEAPSPSLKASSRSRFTGYKKRGKGNI